VSLTVEKSPAKPGDVALSVSDLSVQDDQGSRVVDGCSFEVRKGEIFGIAGVGGNGQDELVEAITGLRKPLSGSVTMAGIDVTSHGPRELDHRGMAYIPADRQRYGLVLAFPVDDNLALTDYHEDPFSRYGVLVESAFSDRAKKLIPEYDIRTPSANVAVGTLSGGNQQKVIVAREFSKEIKVLVADQPTRGLDVGSIEFIHKQIVAKRDAGTAVLLVSAELDEVLELSDRIGVMYRGKLVAVIEGKDADKDKIGLLMATGRVGGAQAGEAA
jgi:general nucleoside transport system ATP-binding protein